jgi:predicted transcriptional regulator
MQERELRLLASRGAVKAVAIHEQADRDGFHVLVDGEPLQSARKDARRFASLDTAATLLRGVGVRRFVVQLGETA